MIPVKELCLQRRIRGLDLPTPVLVPSFSSRGFPNVKWILHEIKDFLPKFILISSYDVYYDLIDSEINGPLVVFVDSGGYETLAQPPDLEYPSPGYMPQPWNREKHLETLDKIKTCSAIVTVSFDAPDEHMDFVSQVQLARELYMQRPATTRDFLVKPYNSDVINIDDLKGNLHLLEEFDLIGVTEKELGVSLVTRLQNLAHLRSALSAVGLETPIHVFGCFDPLSMWLFYLCGADVFDGLSWLRFAFYDSTILYPNSWSIMTNRFTLCDAELLGTMWLQNLEMIRKQQIEMKAFSATYDAMHLPIPRNIFENVLNVAGVSL